MLKLGRRPGSDVRAPILAAAVVLASIAIAPAQATEPQFALNGYVRDGEGEPLMGSLYIVEDDAPTTYTQASGWYSIPWFPASLCPCNVTVSVGGFETQTVPVDFVSGFATWMNFTMVPLPPPPPPDLTGKGLLKVKLPKMGVLDGLDVRMALTLADDPLAPLQDSCTLEACTYGVGVVADGAPAGQFWLYLPVGVAYRLQLVVENSQEIMDSSDLDRYSLAHTGKNVKVRYEGAARPTIVTLPPLVLEFAALHLKTPFKMFPAHEYTFTEVGGPLVLYCLHRSAPAELFDCDSSTSEEPAVLGSHVLFDLETAGPRKFNLTVVGQNWDGDDASLPTASRSVSLAQGKVLPVVAGTMRLRPDALYFKITAPATPQADFQFQIVGPSLTMLCDFNNTAKQVPMGGCADYNIRQELLGPHAWILPEEIAGTQWETVAMPVLSYRLVDGSDVFVDTPLATKAFAKGRVNPLSFRPALAP